MTAFTRSLYTRLSIKGRILALALFPLGAILGYSAYAYEAQRQLALMTHQILDRRIVMMQSAEQVKQTIVAYDDGLFRYLETGDPSPWRESRQLQAVALGEISQLQHRSSSPVVSERLMVLESEAIQYFSDAERLLQFSGQSHTPIAVIRSKSAGWVRESNAAHLEFAFLSNEGRARLVRVFALCDEVITVNRLELERAQREMNELLRHSRATAFVISALSVGLLLALALGLALSLLGPLQNLMDGVRRMEQGDLNVEIPVTSRDELGELTTAFNRATRLIREQREALWRETITDSLTGIYNQRQFRKLLRHEVERAQRTGAGLALLMIDIDHFKSVNDTYGHEFGNEVLKRVASRLREALREVDLIARYGGDELAVILPNTGAPQAQQLAHRVLLAVGEIRLIAPHPAAPYRPTISLGGAACPDDTISPEELVRKADEALYAAKQAGRARLHWSGTAGPLAVL